MDKFMEAYKMLLRKIAKNQTEKLEKINKKIYE
jgi:hypothetical protein